MNAGIAGTQTQVGSTSSPVVSSLQAVSSSPQTGSVSYLQTGNTSMASNAGSQTGVHPQADSTVSHAGNTSSQGTALVPSQEEMQALQVLNPRLEVLLPKQLGLVHLRKVVLLPSQEATWAAWLLNPRVPAPLPRHLMLVLPRQVPHRSSRNSPP